MESLSPLNSVFVPPEAEGNADVPQGPYKTLSFWFGNMLYVWWYILQQRR